MKTVTQIIVGSFFFCASFAVAQIGIGTTDPRTTLDVVGNPTDVTLFDGIKAPEITGDQLDAKTYTAAQTGAIVYVTEQATTPAGQVVNITSTGYYYFNGTQWVKLTTGSDKPDVYFTNDNNLTNIRSAETFTGSESIVALGVNAARNSVGNRIVAIGDAAAQLNTRRQVVAIGHNAAGENTGEFVHAIGQGAGFNNSGTNIHAIGQGAARQNIGNFVTAFGVFAAGVNSGNRVVAIGDSTAYNNTANQVVALGQNAARNNTNQWVHAIGLGAGFNNSGNNLIAIGQGAARENSGNNVHAIGQNAARLNTGSNVIAIGRLAGRNNQGANNTFIGPDLIETVTGSNNILIGRQLNLPNSAASGQLNIQNIIYGTNNSGIDDNVSIGNIGIGVREPNSKLQVGGSFAANIRVLTTGTVSENDYTVLVEGAISLPSPVDSTGRIYNLINNNTSVNVVTGTFKLNGGIVTDYELNNTNNGRGVTVQSDGTAWVIISRY